MSNGTNTRQDGDSYDWFSYPPDRITDANNLQEAWIAARQDSDWKPKVQMYEMDWLGNNAKLQEEIALRTYAPQQSTEFTIRERGKPRVIHGNQVRDRVVEHSLNDNVVIPAILPYLIYDNGASLKNKGIAFTRQRIVAHLSQFYRKHGNDGFVLLIDFSKYYDNIRHDVVMKQFEKYINDETGLWLLAVIISQFEVDVSFKTDEEYARCMDEIFSSLEYQKIDKSLLTGEKFMGKHLDIGNQTSQCAGIIFPTPIDYYIKIVRGEKFYERYMDDGEVIHQSKEHLENLMNDIINEAHKTGIFINEQKTRIVKLSDYWRFLQIQYSLTDTGRIIRKINPHNVAVERRKMKYLAPRRTEKDFYQEVRSWVRSNRKYMSRKQYENIVALYNELREVTIDYVPDEIVRRGYVFF